MERKTDRVEDKKTKKRREYIRRQHERGHKPGWGWEEEGKTEQKKVSSPLSPFTYPASWTPKPRWGWKVRRKRKPVRGPHQKTTSQADPNLCPLPALVMNYAAWQRGWKFRRWWEEGGLTKEQHKTRNTQTENGPRVEWRATRTGPGPR